MKNIIFICPKTYNDSLVGEQLVSFMKQAVLIDTIWCNYTNIVGNDELMDNIALDNLTYNINNFLLANVYQNIIINVDNIFEDKLESIISHLNIIQQYNISVLYLTNTNDVEIENYELVNKEYDSHYVTLPNNLLVKESMLDTTGISAFKIAKTIEEIVSK